MAGADADGASVDPTWPAFAGRHPGNPFLTHDPLYALSEPLIEAVRTEVPDFFTAQEEDFERDLARTASLGFFRGRPQGPSAAGRPILVERWQAADAEIRGMVAGELASAGANPADVGEYFERRNAHRDGVSDRRSAYLGWLLLDPLFRGELRKFQQSWDGAVGPGGRFPALPTLLLPDPTRDAAFPPDFREACYDFYYRWGLDTLATWDWPVPMEPDLNSHQRRDPARLSSSGVFLFLPWYMLRGEALDLREVARQARVAAVPDHLRVWVANEPVSKGDNLGEVRYGNIVILYRYYELVLRRRYAAACRGRTQRIDRAFARILDRDEDSVKKLRLQLARAAGPAGGGQFPA